MKFYTKKDYYPRSLPYGGFGAVTGKPLVAKPPTVVTPAPPRIIAPPKRAVGVLPMIKPAPAEPSPVVLWGGLGLGALGLMGGIFPASKWATLGTVSKVLAGVGSAGAAVGGTALTVANVRRRAAYDEHQRERQKIVAKTPDLITEARASGRLPVDETIEQALGYTRYLKRDLLVPGTAKASVAGVDALPGDWEFKIYDEERHREVVLLCTNTPREGMKEIKNWFISDPGKGVAAPKNYVSFEEDWLPDRGYYRKRQWERGEDLPAAAQNVIWALPIYAFDPTTGTASASTWPLAKFVQGLAAAMGRPFPQWVVAFSGMRGGQLVSAERAFLKRTDLWDDILSNVVFGLARVGVAMIGGFVAGGAIGGVLGAALASLTAALGLGTGIAAAVAGMVLEIVSITYEAVKTGRIRGDLKDLAWSLLALADYAGIRDQIEDDFSYELGQLMNGMELLETGWGWIQREYGEMLSWIDSLPRYDKIPAQLVAGQEGALASVSSQILMARQVPWQFEQVRLIEEQAELDLTGMVP